MKKLKIPERDWVDPRVEIKNSSLGGKGMFAKKAIKKGEVVVVWGGKLFTAKEIKSGKARRGSIAAIDEGLYLAGDACEGPEITDFTNHSCDPNLWMRDAFRLEARRNIKKGEELTADYAMWQADEGWEARWRCSCGSPLCRKRITGRDWKLPDLQKRYKEHFSPFINKRIKNLGVNN